MKNKKNIDTKKDSSQKKEAKKKEISVEQKKKLIIYITIATLTITVIHLYFISNKYIKSKKTDQENVIEYIEQLGKEFYEGYYYPQLSELKKNNMIEDIPTFLGNFTDSGIPVSLNKLIDLHFRTEDSINKIIGKYKCDFSETKFVIYPKEPYEKKSYKLEPQIICERLSVEK